MSYDRSLRGNVIKQTQEIKVESSHIITLPIREVRLTGREVLLDLAPCGVASHINNPSSSWMLHHADMAHTGLLPAVKGFDDIVGVTESLLFDIWPENLVQRAEPGVGSRTLSPALNEAATAFPVYIFCVEARASLAKGYLETIFELGDALCDTLDLWFWHGQLLLEDL